MPLQSRRHAVDDHAQAQEFCHARGWSDGLPVVPATPALVQACLDEAGLPPAALIGVEPVRGRAISAEKIAVNAVMAGCRPVHFPVVATAWTAMLQDRFLLHGATASTGGCAILLIINGPVRAEIGCRGDFSALGGGDHASAVIGRAIRLGLINLLDLKPGALDRSTLGHPGKLSYCIAEDEEGSPWPALAQARGIPEHASAVTVMAAGAPRQIMNEWTHRPEEILDTYVAEMRANMLHYSIWAGDYVLVMAKQHRDHLQRAGWSRTRVAEYVASKARVTRSQWADVGKAAVVRDKAATEYAALPTADDLLIVAAGGPAGGFGAVIPPWLGTKSRAVTMAIGACLDCAAGAT